MLTIYVVDEDCSMLLTQVYECLLGLEGAEVLPISRKDVLLIGEGGDRRCCFVLSHFRGECYKHLRALAMTIFGPQIMLECLEHDEALPRGSVPVYSRAMRGLQVAFTGISAVDRENLKELVVMMSGTVCDDLSEGVSVLVAGAVGTRKYAVAGERRLPIMAPSWLASLWTQSGERNPVDPWDVDLVRDSRLPILHGLCVCLSGMEPVVRDQVRALVERHGALFQEDLRVGQCTHLIAQPPGGQKCLHAAKWRIPVVGLRWLTDSIERGYSLEVTGYSTDGNTESWMNDPEEARLSQAGQDSETSATPKDQENLENLEEKDDPEDSDIFVTCILTFKGLDRAAETMWATMARRHGAVVVSTTTNEATHIVADESAILPHKSTTKVVSTLWLQHCVDEDRLLDETPYLISKVALEGLPQVDTAFHRGVFEGHQFVLHEALTNSQRADTAALITENDGSLVDQASEGVLLVAPHLLRGHLNLKAVTITYLESCLEHGSMLPLDGDLLFTTVVHGPPLDSLLARCVLSFCGYPPRKVGLLKDICKGIGATVQDGVARKALPKRRVLATTHLVASQVDKQSYPSAIAWGIPVVTSAWIQACVSAGALVSTEGFLLFPEGRPHSQQAETGALKRKDFDDMTRALADISNAVQPRPGIRRKVDHDHEEAASKAPRRIFMFTNIGDHDRQRYKRLIESLGGQMASHDRVGAITHLVSSAPRKGDKFLAALAAGKWILHTSYLEEVDRAKSFLEEAPFEFGGIQVAKLTSACLSEREKVLGSSLSSAAHRWRLAGGGAFKGWRVAIVDSETMVRRLGNIIVCGGGTLVPLDPAPDHLTHLLISTSQHPGQVDLQRYPCFRTDFLHYFLTASSTEDALKLTKKSRITTGELSAIMKHPKTRLYR